MKQTKHKILSVFLSFCMIISCMVGISVTASAEPTETLLTTITATAKEQASYSTANVATVSFSYTAGGSSAYLANWGWWGYGWTATVNAAEGYTITKCVFYDDQDRKATDSEAPFVVETTEENKTPQVNGNPILADTSKGIKKIEVYGYATPSEPPAPVITLRDIPVTYDGSPKNLILSVEYSGTDLYLKMECIDTPPNTIYWTKYNGSSDLTNVFAPKNAGIYEVYYYLGTPDNWEVGTKVGRTSIAQASPRVNNFTFTAPNSLNYDGNAKTATVTTKDGVNGMGDVTVRYYSDEYRDNEVNECINPGTYYVGIEVDSSINYTSENCLYDDSWKFTIAAPHTHSFTYSADGATITAACTTGCDITEGLTMTISAPTALTYDGTAKEASLSTGYNTTAFPGTYTIEYYNGTTKLDSAPVNAGTYTAKVTAGTGDGAATASVDFTITPKTVSSPTITLSPESFTYDGSAKQPTVTVKDGTTEISSDEYTVTYSNNTNAGTATVTITDKDGGNYTVSGTKTFTITAKELTNPTITLSPESFTYDGTAKEPTVTVKDGTTVIPASEYNVEYSNNTNAGTATVTITDKTGGNYTVSGTKTFTIAPASQTAPAVSSTNETIAGKADGTITGVTTAMEYKLSTATEYTPITGTSVTGLAAGTYNVRYAEKANYNASPATNVVIGAGNKITVTFNANGGTPAPASQQFNYNQTVSKPATDPTKTGYTFKFWSADGTAEYAFNTPLTANITLTAVYDINSYTITFDTDGGSAIAAITQDYNTTVTAPADPTKTGYTFNGWDKEIPETMPAEDITIKAKWTVNQYTITFDTDGGTEVAPITQDYNTAVTAPADPTKTGYTFDGWDKEIPETMPAEDITIKAQWTINQYTITFVTNSGTTIAPITADYGTEITAPARPTRSGYAFKGWDPIIPATMPAYNLTVTAQWISTDSFTPSVPSSTTTTTTTTTSSSVDSASSKAKMWAVQNDDKSSITVGWEKVNGATKYSLYVRKNGKLEKVVDTKKTKVLIKNPANNTNLEYVLKYTIGGVESAENSAYTASIKVYYKPAVKATSKNGAVTLKWNKVPEATKYRVYKYVNGKLVKVADTKANAVRISKVTAGKTYKYAVKAYVDGKWTKVTKSDIVSVKVK